MKFSALFTIAAASLLAIGTSAQDVGDGFITKCAKPGMIAMTFDDGPGTATPKLLDILAANKVKIAFFVLGVNSNGKQDLLKRMLAEGHEIAVHTYNHKDLNTLTAAQVDEEIRSTADLVKQYTGFAPIYGRPPYGNCNAVCSAAFKKYGMKVVQWNLDTNDWQWSTKPNPGEITVKTITDLINKGNPATDSYIHLQHDIWPYSVDVTEQIIKLLQGKGYRLVSLSECISGVAAGPAPSAPANTTAPASTAAPASASTAKPSTTAKSSDAAVNAFTASQTTSSPSSVVSNQSGAMMNAAPSMLATFTIFSAVLAFLA